MLLSCTRRRGCAGGAGEVASCGAAGSRGPTYKKAMPLPFRITSFTADEVLSPYMYVFYAAFVVAFMFTPIMRAVALYYGIVDQPDKVRKMHSTPVAYLGGVAVFL